MKPKIVVPYLFYTLFFASVYLRAFGPETDYRTYLENFHGVMEVLYWCSAVMLGVGALIFFAIKSSLKVSYQLRIDSRDIPREALEQAIKKRRNIFYKIYLFAGFYPVIAVTGIFLGDFSFFAAMLLDAVSGRALYKNVEDSYKLIYEKLP